MTTIHFIMIGFALMLLLIFYIRNGILFKKNMQVYNISPQLKKNNEEQQVFIELSRLAKYRCKIFTYGGFAIVLTAPICFLLITILDTYSLGVESIGQENYDSRMYDSFLYFFVMVMILFLIIIPFIFLRRQYLQQYLLVLETLTDEELIRVKEINDTLSFFEKCMPPYIVKDKTAIFFRVFLGTTILNFSEISTIRIKKNIRKGYVGYRINIIISNNKQMFPLNFDFFLKKNLIDSVLKENSNIQINEN